MPEKSIMILIDGSGWKSGAIRWLKEAVRQKKYTTKINKDKKYWFSTLLSFLLGRTRFLINS